MDTLSITSATGTTWADKQPSSPRAGNDTEPQGPSALGISLDTVDEAPPTLREGQPERPPRPKRPSRTTPPLPPGSRIGDYVINELIATGGFGSVYRAEHASTGVPVALKVLHPELALAPEAVIRFEREVLAIRRIEHPNVVRVIDFGEIRGGSPYFAMELLSGRDLDAQIRATGRLCPDEALAILEPVCAGLAAAHERSIIHRDLKASNVFLADTIEGRRVVLLDFGVAKLLDDAGPGITTTSHILGTPASMAPEQITARKTDARTDIYALGALIYYLLTGELPFLDASLSAILHMHLYSRPPAPSLEAPVSSAFDEIVARAMAKAPEDRYSSVGELISAFRAAARGVGTESAARGGDRKLDRGLRDIKAFAVHVEICADAHAMEAPDEPLLADLERVLPLAASVMTEKGFCIALQTGNSIVLIREISADPEVGAAERREAIEATVALRSTLDKRDGQDPRVYAGVSVHVGSVFTIASKVAGGELLDLSAWVPTDAIAGVIATSAAVEGLGLILEALGADRFRVL